MSIDRRLGKVWSIKDPKGEILYQAKLTKKIGPGHFRATVVEPRRWYWPFARKVEVYSCQLVTREA